MTRVGVAAVIVTVEAVAFPETTVTGAGVTVPVVSSVEVTVAVEVVREVLVTLYGWLILYRVFVDAWVNLRWVSSGICGIDGNGRLVWGALDGMGHALQHALASGSQEFLLIEIDAAAIGAP